MTLVNGMQVKKAQGRAEVVYDGCQPLVAVENGLKLDWQSWEAAENKKPSASQQQRITVLARGPRGHSHPLASLQRLSHGWAPHCR